MPTTACALLTTYAGDNRAVSTATVNLPHTPSGTAGHCDNVYALLKSTSQAFPNDKTPWVHMAQMLFDSDNYTEAIVHALQALQRDPDDTIANRIAAISDLKVSSKALANLTRINTCKGDVNPEAQDLTHPLCTRFGD